MSETKPATSRDLALLVASYRCEAMVWVNHRYTRCGKTAPDVHHMLFRSRGGDVLDEIGETYHLVCLCRLHHDWVHHHPAEAALGGLVIEGQVWVDGGRAVYRGPDPYLHTTYGRPR